MKIPYMMMMWIICLHDAGEYQLAYYWVLFCAHQPRKLKTSHFRKVAHTKEMNGTVGRKQGRKDMQMKSQTKHLFYINVVTSLTQIKCFLATSFHWNRIFFYRTWKDEQKLLYTKTNRMQFEFRTIFFDEIEPNACSMGFVPLNCRTMWILVRKHFSWLVLVSWIIGMHVWKPNDIQSDVSIRLNQEVYFEYIQEECGIII